MEVIQMTSAYRGPELYAPSLIGRVVQGTNDLSTRSGVDEFHPFLQSPDLIKTTSKAASYFA